MRWKDEKSMSAAPRYNRSPFRRPTTARPFTSSPSTESSKYVHLGINELLKKLRSTTVNPGDADADLEKTTNGPYDSISANVELHDDPAAIVDNHASEDYVSTIEPDAVTDPSSH